MALNNDDIKALIAILQKGLESNEDDEPKTIHKRSPRPKTKQPSTPRKKKALNKFEHMDEFTMCKEDTEIDKRIKKPPPSLRNRQFDYVKVQCRICGKKEKIAPSLVESTERYKCNKCSTGAG
jgi:hypothetical protein